MQVLWFDAFALCLRRQNDAHPDAAGRSGRWHPRRDDRPWHPRAAARPDQQRRLARPEAGSRGHGSLVLAALGRLLQV